MTFNNKFVFKKTMETMKTKTDDVRFVFTSSNGITVKVLANKEILSAWSPIFDKMFNGDLKELHDVSISDVSVEAFQQFLQFFYARKINLTMENIAEILYLVEKYNVATARPICVNFLDQALSNIYEIVFVLHLVLKFELDSLVPLCKDKIQENCADILKMFTFDGNGRVQLCTEKEHLLGSIPPNDLATMFQFVYPIIENVVSNPFLAGGLEIETSIIPFTIASCETQWFSEPSLGYSERFKLNELSSFTLEVDKPLLITDVFISEIFKTDSSVKTKVLMWIEEEVMMSNGAVTKVVFTGSFKVPNKDHQFKEQIKFLKPILCELNCSYTIYTKIIPYSPGCYTYGSCFPVGKLRLAPNVNISVKNNCHGAYSCHMVSRLYFAHQECN